MIESIKSYFDDAGVALKIYAVLLSLIGAFKGTAKLRRHWEHRHLQRIWGIKNGERVTLICSELDEPELRQNVEPREFIYNLKYGDVDAYIEVVVTLLKLYPRLKLRIMSAGEALNSRFDMNQTLILIGGPDYNPITAKILELGATQIEYRSPHVGTPMPDDPDEIAICLKSPFQPRFHRVDERDFGYFERIRSPYNSKKSVILIGGCHTLGVTCAAKAFSLTCGDDGEVPDQVWENARRVVEKLEGAKEFAVLIEGHRCRQSIVTPPVALENVHVKRAAAPGII